MTDIIRVLVPLDSHSTEAFQTALGYANAICEQTGAADIILLTHTKNQLGHTALSTMLGDRAIRALGKGPVFLDSGVRFHAETMRTLSWPPRNSVLMVYYADTGILDLADGTRNVVGVVAVPDLPDGANDWAKRWGVIVHGEGRKTAAPLIEDAVVVRALDELTRRVNLSTGIGHPRDKDSADETLRMVEWSCPIAWCNCAGAVTALSGMAGSISVPGWTG